MRTMRYVACLLCLVGCLALWGCGAKAPSGGQSRQGIDVEQYTFQATTRTVTESTQAEDGRVVAQGTWQVPELTVTGPDGHVYDPQQEPNTDGAKIMANFQAHFDNWLQEQLTYYQEVAEAARQDYQLSGTFSDSAWDTASYCYQEQVDSSFWQNSHILCVTLQNYSFTGGAHPYTYRTAATFDLSTGKQISLLNMTEDLPGLQKAVGQELLNQLQQMIAAQSDIPFYSDYEQTLQDWAQRSVFFQSDGLTVVFGVYDLAPYAAGEQVFQVDYQVIAPYLTDYGRQLLELE